MCIPICSSVMTEWCAWMSHNCSFLVMLIVHTFKNDACLQKPLLLLCFFAITNTAPERHKRSYGRLHCVSESYACMNPTLFRKSLPLLRKKPSNSWKKPSDLWRKPSDLQRKLGCKRILEHIPNVGIISFMYRTIHQGPTKLALLQHWNQLFW